MVEKLRVKAKPKLKSKQRINVSRSRKLNAGRRKVLKTPLKITSRVGVKQRVIDSELRVRRETVDTLDIIGIRPNRIFAQLQTEYYQDKGYKDPFKTFWADVIAVRKARKTLLLDGKKDLALQEFIAEQKEIFTRAITDKDYKQAILASVNIARARGVDLNDMPRVMEIIFGNKVVNSESNTSVIHVLNQKVEGTDKTFGEMWRNAYRSEKKVPVRDN